MGFVFSKSKMIIKSAFSFILVLSFFSCNKTTEFVSKSPLKIWFKQPTVDWDGGLPIGNGNLGAMIYGTLEKEIIYLNEETIWTGGKDSYHDKKDAGMYIDTI